MTARDEWRQHWPLVVGAAAGASLTTLGLATFGLFIGPIQAEFGWTRAQTSAGLGFLAIMAVPLSPFAGALIDRFGSRRIALPGVLATALMFSAFALATSSIALWWALWLAYGLVSLSVKTTVWTAAVSNAFTAGRGLALAVTLSGGALTQTIAPLVAQRVIDNYGWRAGFVALGLGWGVIILLLLFPLFKEGRGVKQAGHPAEQERRHLGGLTLGAALRNPALIKLAAATLLVVTILVAVTVHKVPILAELGISREHAAMLASLAGISGLTGKLITGWLLDRYDKPWIGGVSFATPAVALLLLLGPFRTWTTVIFSMVLVGYASAAYIQVCTYFTGRYGGLRNFGKIFGVMASVMALAGGLGPVLGGLVFDRFTSYQPLFFVGIPVSIAAALLVISMGRYPHFAPEGCATPSLK